MKYFYSLLILFCLTSHAFASDTLIYNQTVSLDTVYSQYDNVEVIAHTTITLDAGFTFSSNGNGAFTATADPWNIEESQQSFPPGTIIDSTGTLNGNYVVGTINGQSGVSPSGAATYQIPIKVPAGNRGMVPQLSVSYNSQSGNGMMGRGWNLGGLSSIVATGKTRYFDNESTAISSTDTACRVVWDGQRLLALNNAGLEADSFRTEMASNVKITTTGSGNTMWFSVKTPDGRTMEYGNTTDSRLALDASTQWRWMLNKVYDRNGNTIKYTYTKDESIGEVLLSEIEYGGATANPVNTITFHYATRTDIRYAYIHDDLVLNDQLLDSISMESNSEYYGSYGFQYSTTEGESLLDEVVQYDKDNYRFNATTVSWETPAFYIAQTAQTQTIESGTAYYQFTGDFTGDGIFDLVAVELNYASDIYTYDLYKGTSSGLPTTADESGNLPRSYTHKYWDAHSFEFDSNCPSTASSSFNEDDISYVFSGDFDGDGVEELMVKVMEWEELSNYLPPDLNDGFTAEYLGNFGGFYDNICNFSTDMESPDLMLLSYGIGHFLHFDKTVGSGERVHTIRLGESMLHKKQYSQFPDIDGRGYNSFPDNNSLVYYDPVNDTIIAFCSVTGEQRWGYFNGDGKADYIDPANTSFSIYTYDPSSNSYSVDQTVNDYFLGTIDLNGDGITAWVALGDEGFETLTYAELWAEWCDDNDPSCSYTDPNDWASYLSTYNLTSAYNTYKENTSNCPFGDDHTCRYGFVNSSGGSIQRSLGYELVLDHMTGRGPDISFGYYEGTHSAESPLLTRAIEADIDTDGKNDLLIFSGSSLKTIYYDFVPSYSEGNITYTCSTAVKNLSLDDNIHLGDFNGDGITELIFPDADKSLCFITSGNPGRRVSSIENGLGVESRYTYKPLTDTSVYSKVSDASFPVIDFTAPWYVTSSVARDNGVADSTYMQYDYEGAKIHLQGKGFLGFMKTTVENNLLNTSQISTSGYETSFYQTYPVSTLTKVGAINVTQSNSYVSIDSLDVYKYKVETDSVKVQNYLLGTTTTTAFQYNNDGLLEEKETNVDGVAIITEDYNYTNAGWYMATRPESVSKTYNRSGSTETDSICMSYSSSTGNLTQQKTFSGTDREVTTNLAYDSFGNPTRQSVISKRGQSLSTDSVITTMAYTADGRFLVSKSAPLNHKETYEWDLSTGMPETQTATNRTETTLEYGPFLRRKKTIRPDNIEGASAMLWASGRTEAPTGALTYKWGEVSGTPEVLTFYDEVGRELRRVTTGFEADLIYTDTEYDSKGRVYRKSMPYFSVDSKYWTTYTYDSYGRISKDSAANSLITSYSYSDLETQISISDGDSTLVSSTELNALGETITSTDDANNTVTNIYCPDGKLKWTFVSSHSSDTILFGYDAQDNRTSIKDPDAGTITSLYDGFGSLLRQINAKDDTATYLYDDIGRITKQTDARGDIFYSYVTDTTKASFGLVDSLYNFDKSMQNVFTYDSENGRLLSQTSQQADKTFTNTYTYDWYGRPMTRTYPSGFEIQYTYTSNGDLDQVSGDNLTLWNGSTVNALGQITGYSQGGYSTSVTYNNFGELNRVATGSIVDMYYDFDDFGNLISREDDKTLQEEKFIYDNLNRLTKIEYYDNTTHITSADLTMAYDNCGNITSKTDISTDIDYGEGTAGPHALTTINDPDESYTPPPQAISYSCFNKVTSITDTLTGNIPLELSFDYGLSKQRIKTTTTRNSTVERVKYFDVDYEEDSTSAGVKKYHYIHGGNGLTAIFVKQGAGNDTMYHVLSDHLGSLTSIVNATSNEVSSYSFNTWGMPRDADDWTSEYTGDLFAGRGFTGHEHLAEFNLINMNGRIYDPIVGRFLSPDPFIQLPQYPNSYNRYSYALNNPLRFIDPSGYKYGPTPLEREHINGEHTYYNWEMAWKLGGDGRLRPDPNVWNNIGRFHHSPGPTGTTANEDGNVVDTYQDLITGQEYYNKRVGGYYEPYYSDQNVFGYSFVFEDGKFRFRKKYKDAGAVYTTIFERIYLDALDGGGGQKDPLLEFVGFNHGIPEFESRLMPGVSGVTPGPFIIYSTNASKRRSLNTHEPGHVVQFFLLRGYKLYIPLVAIPSLITASKPYHNDMPWEKSANQLWYWLTGENHPSNPLYFDKRKRKR